MIRGGCLCGAVRFRLAGAPTEFVHCHCAQCRRASGTGYTSNASFHRTDFELLSGTAQLRSFESSAGVQRWFCGECGSPLWKTRDDHPELLRLRVGTVDGEFGQQAEGHIWTEAAADWIDLAQDPRPRWPRRAQKS